MQAAAAPAAQMDGSHLRFELTRLEQALAAAVAEAQSARQLGAIERDAMAASLEQLRRRHEAALSQAVEEQRRGMLLELAQLEEEAVYAHQLTAAAAPGRGAGAAAEAGVEAVGVEAAAAAAAAAAAELTELRRLDAIRQKRIAELEAAANVSRFAPAPSTALAVWPEVEGGGAAETVSELLSRAVEVSVAQRESECERRVAVLRLMLMRQQQRQPPRLAAVVGGEPGEGVAALRAENARLARSVAFLRQRAVQMKLNPACWSVGAKSGGGGGGDGDGDGGDGGVSRWSMGAAVWEGGAMGDVEMRAAEIFEHLQSGAAGACAVEGKAARQDSLQRRYMEGMWELLAALWVEEHRRRSIEERVAHVQREASRQGEEAAAAAAEVEVERRRVEAAARQTLEVERAEANQQIAQQQVQIPPLPPNGAPHHGDPAWWRSHIPHQPKQGIPNMTRPLASPSWHPRNPRSLHPLRQHFRWGWVLAHFFFFSTRASLVAQATCVGFFLHGIAFFGCHTLFPG